MPQSHLVECLPLLFDPQKLLVRSRHHSRHLKFGTAPRPKRLTNWSPVGLLSVSPHSGVAANHSKLGTEKSCKFREQKLGSKKAHSSALESMGQQRTNESL